MPTLDAEDVFREYGPRIYRRARGILKNHHDAEDVVQSVMLRVVRMLARAGAPHPERLTWRFTTDAVTDRLRAAHGSARRFAALVARFSEEVCDALPGEELDPGAGRLSAALEAAAALSERYRVVVELVGSGLSRDAVAARLGLSEHAVKKRLERARKKIHLTPGG